MTRAKLLVTICQIEWSRSLEYAGFANCAAAGKASINANKDVAAVISFFINLPLRVVVLYSFACF